MNGCMQRVRKNIHYGLIGFLKRGRLENDQCSYLVECMSLNKRKIAHKNINFKEIFIYYPKIIIIVFFFCLLFKILTRVKYL